MNRSADWAAFTPRYCALKYREPAQIRMGEQQRTTACGGIQASRIGQKARRGPDHGVSDAEDVNAGNALADIGMGPLEIRENRLPPMSPIGREQPLTLLGGRAAR